MGSTPCSSGRQPRRSLIIRAAGGEQNLSKQFSEYKKRLQASMPEVEARTATKEAPKCVLLFKNSAAAAAQPSHAVGRRAEARSPLWSIHVPLRYAQASLSPSPPFACRFTSSRSSSTAGTGWNSGPVGDQLRRQERQVLEAWTQERLMQLAAAGTMALVLVLLFSAGGPPADPRCTLPWC